MTLNQFIQINKIKPIDAIIMRKKFFGMVDHYVIYLGIVDNQHKFVANYTNGVKVIPNNELALFLKKLVPEKIERFLGDFWERKQAYNRAISRIGEKNYGFFNNNCEHYKNWVHFGKNMSLQVKNAGTGVAVGGAALAAIAASKGDGEKVLLGLGITALGIIINSLAGTNDE